MDDTATAVGTAEQLPPVVVVAAVPPPIGPPGSTAPAAFKRVDSDEPARIVLQQLDDTSFSLVEWFRYQGKAGAWVVTCEDLPETDLASIPNFFGWFVSRYGAHTLAALLHDHLVHNGGRLEPPVSRKDADDVFLQALTELNVPYLRSRLMWCAVSLGTRWRSSLWAKLPMLLYIVLMTCGIGLLGWSLVTLNLVGLAVALLGPIPASLLWGRRRWGAGLLAGYTLWLVALPAVLDLFVYRLYALAEWAVRLVRILPPNRAKTQTTPPPPYAAR
jgi:hypothetical protein